MPFPRRAVSLSLIFLTLMSAHPDVPIQEGSPTAVTRAETGIVVPEIPPPDERPLIDSIAANNPHRETAIRRGGIAGIALGVILAASGFALMYHAADSEPNVSAIHGGIGLVVSGGLITAFSSAAARYPRDRKSLTAKE